MPRESFMKSCRIWVIFTSFFIWLPRNLGLVSVINSFCSHVSLNTCELTSASPGFTSNLILQGAKWRHQSSALAEAAQYIRFTFCVFHTKQLLCFCRCYVPMFLACARQRTRTYNAKVKRLCAQQVFCRSKAEEVSTARVRSDPTGKLPAAFHSNLIPQLLCVWLGKLCLNAMDVYRIPQVNCFRMLILPRVALTHDGLSRWLGLPLTN